MDYKVSGASCYTLTASSLRPALDFTGFSRPSGLRKREDEFLQLNLWSVLRRVSGFVPGPNGESAQLMAHLDLRVITYQPHYISVIISDKTVTKLFVFNGLYIYIYIYIYCIYKPEQ